MARPKVLLREGKDRKPLGKGWLPNERRPGTSKHLTSTHQKDIMKTKCGEDGRERSDDLGNDLTSSHCIYCRVDTNEYCSEAEVDRIQSLEEEVECRDDRRLRADCL